MASFCAYGIGAHRFCVYGLGVTGQSVINYLNRERKNFSNYYAWDDDAAKRNFFGVHIGEQKGKKIFSESIDFTDFIVLSPGISLKKAKLKKKLIENRHKIITDLDLFYLFNPEICKLYAMSDTVSGMTPKRPGSRMGVSSSMGQNRMLLTLYLEV